MKKVNRLKLLIMILGILLFCNNSLFAYAAEESEVTEVVGKTETVNIKEIDLGDYADTMTVGEKQLLYITVLPYEATGKEVIYISSDTSVATINGLGRITAVNVGKTTISVQCGDKKESFNLSVIEKESDVIPVTDIEISDHEAELDVGETISLTATVFPSDSTENTVEFKSSDTKVATVNSSGEVKGVSKGTVTIYVSAGNVTKEVPLEIKVKTTGIKLDSNYLVLKQGEKYNLTASAMPAEAEQNITFRSINNEIADVSESGEVTALKAGSTSVIVSNGDYTVTVSVIVNIPDTQTTGSLENGAISDNKTTLEHNVKASEVEVIDSVTLKMIYDSGSKLQIAGNGYTLELSGEDIVNYNNPLYSDILLTATDDGVQFDLNQGENLCGKVTLYLADVQGKYLYLYNESKGKYELLQTEDFTKLELSRAGKYFVTSVKLKSDKDMLKYFIIGGSVLIVISVITYIVLRKKYWFW